MNTLLELLKQRRVWSAIVSGIVFLTGLLHWQFQVDVPMLTNLLSDFGGAVAGLVSAGLALWSFLKPKLPKNGQ